jgi:hypothetical protein
VVIWKDKQDWQTLSQTNQRKKKNPRLIKSDMKKGNITTDIMLIQRIFTKLYSEKLENLEEMSKFLDTHNLPKLKQVEI